MVQEAVSFCLLVSVFDLLFLAAAAASIVTLIVAAIRRSLVLVRTWALCAVAYLAIGGAVSYFEPRKVMRVGENWCFDDWCLRVERVKRTANLYDIDLRISSRALRVTQRAKGAWIDLIDDRGRLYPPKPDPSAVPLDALLGPGQSVSTHRVFVVPPGVRQLGLITGHGGPYCGPMSFLIIGGSQCLFQRPPMIAIGQGS